MIFHDKFSCFYGKLFPNFHDFLESVRCVSSETKNSLLKDLTGLFQMNTIEI